MAKTDIDARRISAAQMYHQLSSYGWFVSPPLDAGDRGSEDDQAPHPHDQELVDALTCVLQRRTSVRTGAGGLPKPTFEWLMWCAYGSVRQGIGRVVPSAGGVYPLSLVAAVRNVHRIDPGWYTYTHDAGLNQIALEERELSDLFRTQHVDLADAAAALFVLADLDVMESRYGERGYRYTLLEAGHVGQNILLAASAGGIGAVAVGGFDDQLVAEALGEYLGRRRPLYSFVLHGNRG